MTPTPTEGAGPVGGGARRWTIRKKGAFGSVTGPDTGGQSGDPLTVIPDDSETLRAIERLILQGEQTPNILEARDLLTSLLKERE